jgi:hypothetical protein
MWVAMRTARRHFAKSRTTRAGVIALICLLPAAAAASESGLTADIALKHWQEADATSITDAGQEGLAQVSPHLFLTSPRNPPGRDRHPSLHDWLAQLESRRAIVFDLRLALDAHA